MFRNVNYSSVGRRPFITLKLNFNGVDMGRIFVRRSLILWELKIREWHVDTPSSEVIGINHLNIKKRNDGVGVSFVVGSYTYVKQKRNAFSGGYVSSQHE